MTLTEQWENRELEEGLYYLRYKGSVKIDYWFGNYWEDGWNDSVEEVLAPVPSYEKWQELSKQRNQLIRDVKDLAYIQEENAKLKELLKECRDDVCKYQYISFGTLVKIDEVLK